MKANLSAGRAPPAGAAGRRRTSTAQVREARKGAPLFVLHDGPPYANGHIHLGTRRQQDPQGPGRSQPVRARATTPPTCPAGTATGCPIELQVDRDLGLEEARDERRSSSAAPAAPTPRSSSRIQREEFERLGILGEWDAPLPHDVARTTRRPSSASSPTSPRRASSTRPRSRSTGASPAARRSPRPRSSTTRTTSAPRSTCASRSPRPSATASRAASRPSPARGSPPSSGPRRPGRSPPTSPSPFHPDARLRLLPGRGHATRSCVLADGAARGLRDALARQGQPPAPAGLGAPLAEAKGASSRACASATPGSTATRPASWPTTSPSTPAPASSTPPPATAGTTTSPASATASTSTARWTRRGASCPRSSASPGKRVFEANPEIVDVPRARRAPSCQTGKDTHSYPICWRCKHPIIFRATEQWFIALDAGRLPRAGPRGDRHRCAGTRPGARSASAT